MTLTIIAITVILIFAVCCAIVSALSSIDDKLTLLQRIEVERGQQEGILTIDKVNKSVQFPDVSDELHGWKPPQ